MVLALNEEQLMLKDAAASFLLEKAPVAALRKLRDERSKKGYSEILWKEMVEMGWAGIAIAEEFDGLGYGYVGLGIVLQELGRHLSASPIFSTVLLSASAIEFAGSNEQKSTLLPAIAAGELLLSFALQEGKHHAPNNVATSAEKTVTGYRLNGNKVFVLDAHIAEKFIVAARTSGEIGDADGISLFLVDSGQVGVSVERVFMLDSRNAGTVSLSDVKVNNDALLGREGCGAAVIERVMDIANAGLSAELLGLSLQAFEQTMEYLKQRVQFGQHIGAFQGLQHRAADMFSELELCKSLVMSSLMAIDNEEQELSILVSATKAKMAQVAKRITNESIQMHGGIGMTDELDIGFYIKRARVAQQTFGDYHYHLDRYALLNGY